MSKPSLDLSKSQVRISSLPKLFACEGAWLANFDRYVTPKAGSAAAHTGTAVGRAIELYHKDKSRGAQAILRQVKEESKTGEGGPGGLPFVKMNSARVRRVLEAYYSDPRTRAGVVLTEYRVTFELAGITFTGTMDQVRSRDNYLEPWDLKLTVRPGEEAAYHYMMQVAGYTVGLAESQAAKGRFVRPGGIIRLSDFEDVEENAKPRVFYPCSELQSLRTCRALLTHAAKKVKRLLGGGEVNLSPGYHCSYCDYSGPGACVVHYDV